MAEYTDPPNKGVHWSDREVTAFLKIWSETDIRRDLDESVRNKQVFQRISAKMASKGFHRDWNQCRIKMKNMKREFKMALKYPPSNHSVMFRGRKFFDELNKLILGPRTSSLPSTSSQPANPPLLDLATLGLIKREETDEGHDNEDDDNGVVIISSSSPQNLPNGAYPKLPVIASTCSMRTDIPVNSSSSTSNPAVASVTITTNTTTPNSNNNSDHYTSNEEIRGSESEERIRSHSTLSDIRSLSSGSITINSSTTEPIPTSSPVTESKCHYLMGEDYPSEGNEPTLAGALGRLADALVRVADTHAQLQRESKASDRMERRRENRLRRRHEEHMRAQEREHQLKMVRLILASMAASVTGNGY